LGCRARFTRSQRQSIGEKMNDQFYKEITPAGFGIAIKQKEILFSEQSPFQKVEIIDTDSALGKILTLDGLMMTTEGDEQFYHEMISHIR
jgi:spermidine synthase